MAKSYGVSFKSDETAKVMFKTKSDRKLFLQLLNDSVSPVTIKLFTEEQRQQQEQLRFDFDEQK